jgi:hypothetical protein
VEASGDTAEVALKLAGKVDRQGATPSTVRELRYALLALGVTDLEPYRRLMVATKAAIDASDESLPTLAAQLREQEQTCQRLSVEPSNSRTARAVREAVDEIVGHWERLWEAWRAGDRGFFDDRDAVNAYRVRAGELWRVIDEAGGESVFPDEVERATFAFDDYWQGRCSRRTEAWADLARPEIRAVWQRKRGRRFAGSL